MLVAAVSDLHGYLPEIPDCDLLLLGGDYSPDTNIEYEWHRDLFRPWLDELSERNITVIGVAGNHDWIFQKRPDLIKKLNLKWNYLEDSQCTFKNLKIWGSPWQKRFFDWAFNLDEIDLAKKWNLIPGDTDILVLHGPPYMYGDFSTYGREHCGSPSLTETIKRLKPKLVVFGHIHLSYGRYQLDDTILLNCSYVNDQYRPANAVQVIEL